MLDLSSFAISLVAGWAMMFLRWPGGGLAAKVWVAAVWLLWAVGLAVLVRWTGVPWALVAAGVGLGLGGHAVVLVHAGNRGR
jgi:hypothetical protein